MKASVEEAEEVKRNYNTIKTIAKNRDLWVSWSKLIRNEDRTDLDFSIVTEFTKTEYQVLLYTFAYTKFLKDPRTWLLENLKSKTGSYSDNIRPMKKFLFRKKNVAEYTRYTNDKFDLFVTFEEMPESDSGNVRFFTDRNRTTEIYCDVFTIDNLSKMDEYTKEKTVQEFLKTEYTHSFSKILIDKAIRNELKKKGRYDILNSITERK